MALEPMGAFFARRLEGYDEHMLRDIAGAREFYPAAAALLPGNQPLPWAASSVEKRMEGIARRELM